MHQWLPVDRALESDELYIDLGWADPDGPAVLAVGMVVGIDGGVTVDGRSRRLGGPGDRAAFRALRAAADVILVGAGTARIEEYGVPRVDPGTARRREAEGRRPTPRLALVTRSGGLDPGMPVFSDPANLPMVVTSRALGEEALAPVADLGVEIVRMGDDEVDLAAAMAEFTDRGLAQVLCEGGPTLNTAAFEAGVVGEVFVTLAPTVTGSTRHLLADALASPVPLDLLSVVHADGDDLLLRYRVRRDG